MTSRYTVWPVNFFPVPVIILIFAACLIYCTWKYMLTHCPVVVVIKGTLRLLDYPATCFLPLGLRVPDATPAHITYFLLHGLPSWSVPFGWLVTTGHCLLTLCQTYLLSPWPLSPVLGGTVEPGAGCFSPTSSWFCGFVLLLLSTQVSTSHCLVCPFFSATAS